MTDFNDKQIQILQVAEKLFAEKGFDGTSIRAISKQAKINIAKNRYFFIIINFLLLKFYNVITYLFIF